MATGGFRRRAGGYLAKGLIEGCAHFILGDGKFGQGLTRLDHATFVHILNRICIGFYQLLQFLPSGRQIIVAAIKRRLETTLIPIVVRLLKCGVPFRLLQPFALRLDARHHGGHAECCGIFRDHFQVS